MDPLKLAEPQANPRCASVCPVPAIGQFCSIPGGIPMPQHRLAALTLAAALSLSGCSLSRSNEGSDSPSTSASSSDSATDSGSAQAQSDQQAKDIGLDPDNLPKPLATEKLMVDPAKNQTADVALYKLEKRGRIVLAYFSVTPHNFVGDSVYEAFGERSPQPAFLDLENLKIYKPVRSEYSDVGSDPVYTAAATEKASFYWVALPAPLPQAKALYMRLTETSSQHHKIPVP